MGTVAACMQLVADVGNRKRSLRAAPGSGASAWVGDKALGTFDPVIGAGQPGAGKGRALNAVGSGNPGIQRFAHRAELALEPRGAGGAEAERGAGLLG